MLCNNCHTCQEYISKSPYDVGCDPEEEPSDYSQSSDFILFVILIVKVKASLIQHIQNLNVQSISDICMQIT